jgi:VanZ family protein
LQRVRRPLALAMVLTWMGLIWMLSSIEQGPGNGLLGQNPFFTNLAHAPEFGLLCLWLLLLVPRREGWIDLTPRRACFVWAATVAYAVVDELHQRWVPGRDSTPFDVLTDGIGAACVLWIVSYLGTQEANERGLWKRLALGLAACALAASLSTSHASPFGV